MMQFWNPLIMRYHACDKALPVSLLLERRVDFYIWVLKGPPTKMCDAAARARVLQHAATQSLTVARLQHKLQHKAATQIWGLEMPAGRPHAAAASAQRHEFELRSESIDFDKLRS